MPASFSESSLADLERAIGHTFENPQLPLEALTHRTYSHEHPDTAPFFNERLEFLGDSVLGFVVSEELYRRFPERDEGFLSRLKAAVVQDRTLSIAAERIDLGGFVRLGRGEEKTGGREKPSLLADAMEALFAAVFLDGGLEPARRVILTVLDEAIGHAARRGGIEDAKTALQERAHQLGYGAPDYRICAESGPDHEKTFDAEVILEGAVVGRGRGANKKEAEKDAASQALDFLEKGRVTQEGTSS